MVLVESFLLVAGNCLEQCPCAVQCNGRVQIFETKKVQRSLDIICQSFWFLVLQMTCIIQFPTASMIILRHLLQQATSSSSSSFKSNSTKECQGVKPIADSSGTLASKKSLSTMCNVWYQPKWCVHYYKLQSVWSYPLSLTDWKGMFCRVPPDSCSYGQVLKVILASHILHLVPTSMETRGRMCELSFYLFFSCYVGAICKL